MANNESIKDALSTDQIRKEDRDSRTLFVKNLPTYYSVNQVREISDDIKQVRIRPTFKTIKKKSVRMVYAYLEFDSEAQADKNYKILAETVIDGNKLIVDYLGAKSNTFNMLKHEPEEINELLLYITGLPENTTEEELQELFPDSTEVVLPTRKKDKKLYGFGFVHFDNPELAKKAHSLGKNLTLRDNALVVLYGKKTKGPPFKKFKKNSKRPSENKDAEPSSANQGTNDADNEVKLETKEDSNVKDEEN